MRDINRIQPTLESIKNLWMAMPDDSICDVFEYIQQQKRSDCFYMEDEKLTSCVNKLSKELHEQNNGSVYDISDEQQKVLLLLNEMWSAYCDWRLMQLICNLQKILQWPLSNQEFIEMCEELINGEGIT